jgi:hypothetical protein
MILNDILRAVASFLRHDNDDYVDRLHYFDTVIGLSIYLIFISSNSFAGSALQCLTSNEASGSLISYVHSM